MYLRVSVTDRCNLRCTYCMPALARFRDDGASAAELDALMEAVCSAVPVHKIRITGGEPTLAPTLMQHVRAAVRLSPLVGLTSNGVSLQRHLDALKSAGLQRLNISLDAADAAGFAKAARVDRLDEVLASIRAARRLGFTPLKVNAVATIDTDVVGLARLAIAEGFHLRFIELMDIGEARRTWAERHVPAGTLQEALARAGLHMRAEPSRDEPTSRVWTIDGVQAQDTTIGFITTVSDPFCATCDRIRLSSQGRLHTCLFDERGVDLLEPLRAGDVDGLLSRIRRAVAAKSPPAAFVRSGAMFAIGG